MATKERLESLARNRAIERGDVPVPEDPTEQLDDPEVQEAILNPGYKEVRVAGETVCLYPLPAKPARSFVAFTARIVADTSAANDASDVQRGLRLAGVLGESQANAVRVIEYAALSTNKPGGKLDIEQAAKIGAELDAKITSPIDLAVLFSAMMDLNNAQELLRPKND